VLNRFRGAGGIRRRCGGALRRQFLLDIEIDFFAVHAHFLGRIDADPDAVALSGEKRDFYAVANEYGFADASDQYQHTRSSLKVLLPDSLDSSDSISWSCPMPTRMTIKKI
jgi:hypothetical protein